MPSEPGELGSFSSMARPDAVRGEGLGCSVAPLQGLGFNSSSSSSSSSKTEFSCHGCKGLVTRLSR
jgi:hypothetical protein